MNKLSTSCPQHPHNKSPSWLYKLKILVARDSKELSLYITKEFEETTRNYSNQISRLREKIEERNESLNQWKKRLTSYRKKIYSDIRNLYKSPGAFYEGSYCHCNSDSLIQLAALPLASKFEILAAFPLSWRDCKIITRNGMLHPQKLYHGEDKMASGLNEIHKRSCIGTVLRTSIVEHRISV